MFSRFASSVPRAAIGAVPLAAIGYSQQQQHTEKQANCIKAVELLPLLGAAAYGGASYYYSSEKIQSLERRIAELESLEVRLFLCVLISCCAALTGLQEGWLAGWLAGG